MQKTNAFQSGLFNPRALLVFALCSVGAGLAMLSFAATPSGASARAAVSMPLASAGNGWSIVNSPNPPASQNDYLPGVTCASANDCWAVGYSVAGSLAFRTLIEHWDGTSWTTVNSANTSTTQDNVLYGVTCASASDCWAVGYYDASFSGSAFQTLIERWDG